MTRTEATALILAIKEKKGVSWAALAKVMGRSAVWATAALMGQHPLSTDEAKAVVKALGLGADVAAALQQFPMRGALDGPVPVDPTIYRFYELIQVYGPTMKALIHEMFGDGIMSAIDFEMDIRKKEDPKGDRVVITLNGKFLPYKKF